LTRVDLGAPAARARARQARLALCVVFGVLGITEGDWLARVPALAHGLHLSDGLLGLVLLAPPAGSLAVAALTGRIADRTGSRLPATAGGIAVAQMPIWFGVAGSPLALALAMLGFGLAAGVLDVAMNAQAVQLQTAAGRSLMTSFHACFSFATLAGGLIGGAFAWAGVGTAADFTAVAIPTAAAAALTGRFLLGPGELLAERETLAASDAGPPAPPGGGDARSAWVRPARRRLLWRSPLLVLSLLALCSLLGEGAANGWSAVYLRDDLGTSAGFAALGYAAFALTMAFGRLAGDRLADRFGPVALLRAGGLLAALGMMMVLITANTAGAIFGFALYGAGLSCTFPQMLAIAGRLRPGRPASAIGRVAGTGYVGFLCGPVVIGGLASAASLSAALVLPAVLALGIVGGARLAVPREPARDDR
jgi:MFS family permease